MTHAWRSNRPVPALWNLLQSLTIGACTLIREARLLTLTEADFIEVPGLLDVD